MIKFGPSGNSQLFYDEGFSATADAPAWVKSKGLDIFEYSFGRGINISSQTADEIGAKSIENGVEITVHAPYFINFSGIDPEKVEHSFGYVLSSLKMMKHFSAKRCVFHPGSPMKRPREEAMGRLKENFTVLCQRLKDEGLDNFILCPETMGKKNQMGTVDEIVELCRISDIFYPCVDWGHINAREGGILKTEEDYEKIFDAFENALGRERTSKMHMHFSHIEYGGSGEIKHLTNADTVYGPFHEPLINVIKKRNYEPYILSESAGTQAIDAIEMKNYYYSL